MTEAFRTKVLNLSPGTSDSDAIQNNDNEVINQLKEKFNTTTDRRVRMQILTTLPKSWALKTIETEFGVSNFCLLYTSRCV